MAYLNCPSCRLTVYRPLSYGNAEDCPRCLAKLGKASPLFRSSVPARLLRSQPDPVSRSRTGSTDRVL